MTELLDDDPDFWDRPAPDPTIQLERIRRRAPERTRTHRVVQRDAAPSSTGRDDTTGSTRRTRSLDDTAGHAAATSAVRPSHDYEIDDPDHDTIWVETSARPWARDGSNQGGRRAGIFGAIDPRLLSVGAVAIAAVLAVPLFSALGRDDGNEESFLTVAEAEPTTTTVAPPTTVVVVVTAALTPPSEDDTAENDSAYSADDAGESASSGNSDSSGGSDSNGSGDSGSAASAGAGGEAAAGVLAPPAERSAAQCGNPYEVQAGDFWVAIADGVGTSLDDLLEYNEATQETPLYPGSTVCLPLGTSMTPDTTVAATEAPTTIEAPSTEVAATPTTESPTAPATSAAPATIAAPATTQPASSDDDNDTGGGIPLPSGSVPSGGEVEQMIRDIWPDDLEDQALRIAWRESNYRPDVTSSTGCCVGVFQLHWEAHNGWMANLGITSRTQLFDARTNILAAYTLYQRSGGWGPWQ